MQPTFTSPNPDANSNIENGRQSFWRGSRDRETVLRDHLQWKQGAAADYHFANGYREAARAAGVAYPDIEKSLEFIDAFPRGADKVRYLKILCEEQVKKYGNAPAQWQLDRARQGTA